MNSITKFIEQVKKAEFVYIVNINIVTDSIYNNLVYTLDFDGNLEILQLDNIHTSHLTSRFENVIVEYFDEIITNYKAHEIKNVFSYNYGRSIEHIFYDINKNLSHIRNHNIKDFTKMIEFFENDFICKWCFTESNNNDDCEVCNGAKIRKKKEENNMKIVTVNVVNSYEAIVDSNNKTDKELTDLIENIIDGGITTSDSYVVIHKNTYVDTNTIENLHSFDIQKEQNFITDYMMRKIIIANCGNILNNKANPVESYLTEGEMLLLNNYIKNHNINVI